MERKPYLNEDWTAVLLGFVIIGFAIAGFNYSLPSFKWQLGKQLAEHFGNIQVWKNVAAIWFVGLVVVMAAFMLLRQKFSWKHVGAYTCVFSLTLVAQIITGNAYVNNLGIEIVLFGLLIGLFISNAMRVPEWLKPLIQTELYIKIGLVLLGTGIIFGDILKAGAWGLLQSVAVVLVVWEFCFWLGKKFRLDDELRTMLASAVAICGVSAAIATAGAIKGDSKKLSYVISLVLITAIPMMLFMPYIARTIGLTDPVAGAWLGGTIDTTGAVVAAGTVLGEEGLKYATVVKFSQNVLLGLAAFAISLYWVYTKNEKAERPTAKNIWDRFPKFVLGFMAASFIFSFLLTDEVVASAKGTLKSLQTFWFALAFTCIGLETKFIDIFKLENGRPAFAFLIAQLFNILFTLLIAWLIFG